MSGYLSRLAGQTGLKMGRAPDKSRTGSPNFQASFAAPAFAPAADMIEQNVQTEASSPALQPTPAASTDETPIRSPTDRRRIESSEIPVPQPTDELRPSAATVPRLNDSHETWDAREIENASGSSRAPERTLGIVHLPELAGNTLDVPAPATSARAAPPH